MTKLAENTRTATKAAIKRASAKSRAAMNRYDREILERLTELYKEARIDLADVISSYADGEETLRLEVLQELLQQINQRIEQLAQARDLLLINDGLQYGIERGLEPFIGAIDGPALSRVADEALRFTINHQMNDGLKLSDRLWRNTSQAKRVIGNAISQAVIQGHSASQAAQDFISRGVTVPRDVQQQINGSNAFRVARVAGDQLMKAEGNPYYNAKRLFRTEINRAHIEAFRNSSFEHSDVIGTRFLLSNRHPKPDICDMHARVNRFGLGPGVYPKGKSPLPAHPNTLSYEEAVFADEVSEEDKNGKQTRIEWLKKQPSHVQQGVLGSNKKRAALHSDLLKENQIATPWKVLKVRYSKEGVDVDSLSVVSEPIDQPGGLKRSVDEVRVE